LGDPCLENSWTGEGWDFSDISLLRLWHLPSGKSESLWFSSQEEASSLELGQDPRVRKWLGVALPLRGSCQDSCTS
jgi:hypothetical protein